MPWTTPATWNVGELVLASKMNTHVRDNLLAIRQIVVRKTADETVNNVSTPQNDDHISFAIAASEVWAFEMWLPGQQGNGTSGWSFNWTVPSGATGHMWGETADVVTVANVARTSRVAIGTTLTMNSTAGTGVNVQNRLWGIIVNSTNAGTAQFQWAMATAQAVNQILFTNGYLVAHAIA